MESHENKDAFEKDRKTKENGVLRFEYMDEA